jgi:hypothetical protein
VHEVLGRVRVSEQPPREAAQGHVLLRVDLTERARVSAGSALNAACERRRCGVRPVGQRDDLRQLTLHQKLT